MRLIFILTILPLAIYGQTRMKELRTAQYSRTFAYAKSETNGSARILIYPETDTTALFYIEVNRGAPSYNMGSLYGRLKVLNGQGTYESKDQDCRWTMQFLKDRLTIETIKASYDCGFENGVVADGTFEQTSKIIPDYFVSREGIKYFFSTMTPEKYNSE